MERKSNFYLLRALDDKGTAWYVQRIFSPSIDMGVTLTTWPEYAWRGETALDVAKVKYLVARSSYSDLNWETVQYYMDVDQVSWAAYPALEPRQYENLIKSPLDVEALVLNPLEQKELEEFIANNPIKE